MGQRRSVIMGFVILQCFTPFNLCKIQEAIAVEEESPCVLQNGITSKKTAIL